MHEGTDAPDTWAVIAGRGARTPGSPLNVPPVLASNFVLSGDRAYTRDDGTATWEAFEELLDGLEHGVTVAFASGMAAAAATFDLLPAGAEVVLPDDCYQAVAGLAAAGQDLGRWSDTRLAPDDTQGWLRAAEHVDLLWLESPSNPLLQVADLPAILSQPREPGHFTFASSAQRPRLTSSPHGWNATPMSAWSATPASRRIQRTRSRAASCAATEP